ncbi:MAG: TetR family transcriptional regulator [Spirochaetaceae bacterium]|jgi:AcrR family transcriptional regulator|nr:TetR family transcriptional regulator [Spirochaetaceae bacterium]
MEITKDMIADAAISVLKRGGIESLTMRSLARELDIKAASLYWHIKGKNDLYNLIAEKISSGIEPSCSMKDPKKYLIQSAKLYREKMLEVRDSVEIFTQSAPVTRQRLELIKNCMICLLHIGVSESNCIIAANMFNNYITAFVADEMRRAAFSNTETSNPFSSILGVDLKLMSGDDMFLRGLEVLFAGFKILN